MVPLQSPHHLAQSEVSTQLCVRAHPFSHVDEMGKDLRRELLPPWLLPQSREMAHLASMVGER